MIETTLSYGGMVVAPHHLATQAGVDVLNEGGNAIEAMVAAAATVAVVYPHMNGLGGDNCWLLQIADGDPIGIDACGAAAGLADRRFFLEHGLQTIPPRGPLASLTVAGAVSGWQRALEISRVKCEGRLPLSRLLEPALYYARTGFPMTASLAATITAKSSELSAVPGFSSTYLSGAQPPQPGERLVQLHLASTFEQLSRRGLDDFYRGDLAMSMADDLASAGSLLRRSDFARHQAIEVELLSLNIAGHRVFNLPPPTQGLASLILLGLYDRLAADDADGIAFVHAIVEATKCAFRIRDSHVSDPDYMSVEASAFLQPEILDQLAAGIDDQRAAPWPAAVPGGDTVWLGAIDRNGRAVSFIQSLYWEFGSGMVLPQTGVTWQNRGTSFSLDPENHNRLEPYRRPLHTIQPPLAHLSDGRIMVYGTMGGDGQPQTQATLFARHVLHGLPLQRSVTAPRWLLGRTWGQSGTSLKIENRFNPEICRRLEAMGHVVELVREFDDLMGHAGALVRHPNGLIEGAGDPRSDGRAQASR